MRLIDADATIKYLREFRCKDCDRRKGMKNGKIRFCYEIGEAPCRACDIGDTIDYFLYEDISQPLMRFLLSGARIANGMMNEFPCATIVDCHGNKHSSALMEKGGEVG